MILSPKGSDGTLTLEHSDTRVPTAKVTCSSLTSTSLSGELPGKAHWGRYCWVVFSKSLYIVFLEYTMLMWALTAPHLQKDAQRTL